MDNYQHVFRNLRTDRGMSRGAYYTKAPKNNGKKVIIWLLIVVALGFEYSRMF